jgi:hypothetical protein
MRALQLGLGACLIAISLAGCSTQKEQLGDKKEDWAKSAPPPQYRGPGQPGGPPSGAMRGPSGPPAGFQNKVTEQAPSGSGG